MTRRPDADQRQRAYSEGRLASMNAASRDDCPYNSTTQTALYCEWMAGYYDAPGVNHG